MRAAEFMVPRASTDGDDGECTVITFGAGKGGGVDENVDRWVGQMDSHGAAPTRTTRTSHGMKVTRVEVAGTYAAMRMPGAPETPPHAGWRLVGAIIEAPSGSWFFKLTGPSGTVQAAAPELDAMVDSARPRS